ncbi:MAG TPA: TolC family protein [Vicinamibacterales bacterium]|nr:TolC family protein [Vicinamibacterales bacterium]
MSRQCIFGVVLALIAPVASAYPQGAPLTLRAALDEAAARNPELVALRQQYEAARSVPAQERFLGPPMLEAQIWGWPIATANPVRTDMYMFTVEQEIPGRGKRAARTLVAERDAELTRQQIAIRANQILGELRQAYIDLFFTRETFVQYARQAQLLDNVAGSATLRYAAGEGVQHHTIVALVEVANLEKERIAATGRAQAAEARLNTLLGRPVSQTVEALAPIVATVSPDDAEERALARHPDVATVAAEVAREEAELERLRGERRPDFVLGGGYMLIPGEPGAWTARAGISWPNAPWSRGRLTTAIEAQSKRVDAAKARSAAISAHLRQVVREAVVSLNIAERHVRLIESTVLPQIEHAFELTRLAYGTGEGSFSEILDARRTLLSTQLEALEARANVARARADLETAAGVL